MQNGSFTLNTTRTPETLVLGEPKLLIDESLIAHQQNLVRRWLPATVCPDPILKSDKPWEGDSIHANTVANGTLQGKSGYRMYYTSYHPGRRHYDIFHPGGEAVCLAFSEDGLHWAKPELGVVEWQGSRANNLVRPPSPPIDSESVLLDPEDVARPFKMIGFQSENMVKGIGQRGPDWGLYAYFSLDGLHWDPCPGVRLRAGDTTSVLNVRHDGRYVIFTRHHAMREVFGKRMIYRSESEDFLHWTEPEAILFPSLADEPGIEFYGMNAFRWRDWYIGTLRYWDSNIDVMRDHLIVSRDTRNWSRPMAGKPFVDSTQDWSRRILSCAGGGPVILNEQMVFYLTGNTMGHNWDSVQHHGGIGIASLPLDRFCALEATYEGHMVTTPILWPGGNLHINADTRMSFSSHPEYPTGEIAIDILDAEGVPLPDWSGRNCAIFRGNTHCRGKITNTTIRWNEKKSIDALQGQVIRLSFRMRNARLFTFEANVRE